MCHIAMATGSWHQDFRALPLLFSQPLFGGAVWPSSRAVLLFPPFSPCSLYGRESYLKAGENSHILRTIFFGKSEGYGISSANDNRLLGLWSQKGQVCRRQVASSKGPAVVDEMPSGEGKPLLHDL